MAAEGAAEPQYGSEEERQHAEHAAGRSSEMPALSAVSLGWLLTEAGWRNR